MRLPSFRIIVPEGAEIPRGYGISHYLPSRPLAVGYPVPVNLIVGGLRSLWWHVRVPPWRFTEWRADQVMKIRREEFDRGYLLGKLETMVRLHSTSVERALGGGQ